MAYRIFGGSRAAPVANNPLANPSKVSPLPEIKTPVIPVRPEYTDAEWNALLKDPAFKGRMLKRSPGCTSAQQRTEWGIPITFRDMKTRPLVGNWRTWMVNEKIRCFEVGQTLHVVTFDRFPTSPVVRYSGTVNVTSIAELPLEDYPQSVFDFFGASRKDAIEFLKKHSSRTPSGMEMLIRTTDIDRAVNPFVDPPRLLPSGIVITRAELSSLKPAEIAIFDVRSPAEFQAATLTNARNAPFGGSDPQAAIFDPAVTNQALSRFAFDVTAINENKKLTIVLVGNSEHDPRPLWASLVLFDLGFSNMVWVIDGVGTKSPNQK